jgi:hypothetical protein
MMKKKLCTIAVIGAIALLVTSCHRDPTEKQIEKLKELSLTYAKEQLKLEVDSVQITKIDTLTQLGYAKITLEMLENLDEQYQLNYHKALLAENDELSSEMESNFMQARELKQKFAAIVDNATVDNEKAFLYMYQAIYWRDGGVFEPILFATLNYKIHDLDPFENNLLEQ